MRLILKFKAEKNSEYDSVNKYTIQGFIYSLLHDTAFSNYHEIKGFKYFTYSNIFPVTNFQKDEIKNLIISSPKKGFIILLKKVLKNKNHFYLGKEKMLIEHVKTFNPHLERRFITSTPLVLYEDNIKNRYYSIENSNDFSFF